MDVRVEDLAADAGTTVATVRYYQSRGLLPPPRRDGRIAYYDDRHRARLRRIRELADQGFTLAQIGRLLDRPGDDSGADPVLDVLVAEAPPPALDRSGLAARTGLPRPVVDLIVDAGLLQPRLVAGEERFDDAAVAMLDAAAAVVRSGVPLDGLFTLAMRHAENVRSLVDDAVALFHDQAGSSGLDREAIATTVESVVPAVTRLVAEHFRRTLLDRALDELSATDAADRVTVRLVPVEADTDPLTLFAAAEAPDAWRMLWNHPAEGLSVAATGAAAVVDAGPAADPRSSGGATTGRFARAAAGLEELATRVDIEPGDPDAPAPTLVGGFAFAPARNSAPDPRWAPLGAGALVLPEIALVTRQGRAWLQLAGRASATLDGLEATAHDLLRRGEHRTTPEPAAAPAARWDPAVDPGYEALVTRGLAAIARGDADKLVLARAVPVAGAPPVACVVDALRGANPRCVTFAVGFGTTTFVGATPELLVELHDGVVSTTAVAGTRRRDPDPGVDDALEQELLADPKERAEHAFVVEHLQSALAKAGVSLDAIPDTTVTRYATVLHLTTPITGRADLGADGLIDLVGRLHPTPAVGGAPVDTAASWLAANEGLDRGWYAGPVGAIDLDGNGEFWVALRSALLDDDGAVLFAGAGVVEGSDPQRELDETTAKLTTMGLALGAEPWGPR